MTAAAINARAIMALSDRLDAKEHLDAAAAWIGVGEYSRAVGYLQEAAELMGFELKPLPVDASAQARLAMGGL